MRNTVIALSGAALIIAAYAASSGAAEAPTLDLAGVTGVKITGDASSIKVTTDSARPFRAELGAMRQGALFHWTSGWFGNDCTVDSRMHADNGMLLVEAADSSWFGFADCAPVIVLNLADGASLAVNQHAAEIRARGQFSEFRFEGHAGDITLDGYARAVSLSADALETTLAFDHVEKTETVDLSSPALDASVRFGDGVAVDYRVDAKASMVDARQASTPGVMPRLRVEGKFVRISLR
jgi:hypothetical protein